MTRPVKYGTVETAIRTALNDIEYEVTNADVIHDGRHQTGIKRFTVKTIATDSNGVLPEFLVLLDILVESPTTEITINCQKRNHNYHVTASWEQKV